MWPLQMNESTYTFKNTKRGYITVEAAIFLPIFIIGILTFAYLIKFLSIQEGIFHTLTDEARVLCSEARINPASSVLFELKLKDRIYDENSSHVSNVDVDHFLFLYPCNGLTGLISMDLNYDVNIKLPIQFYDKLPVSESLLFRGFVGKETSLDPMSFEDMEKEKRSNLVWVFPRSGGRFHGENCTYVKSEPRQMIMSGQIRSQYDPCSLCDSNRVSDGKLIYCFRTGHSYHLGSCTSVDKYVISIEMDDAISKGYTRCSKCGGE